MTTQLIILLIVIALAVLALILIRRKPARQNTLTLYRSARHVQTTPGGIKIYGRGVPMDVQRQFDAGATDAIEVADVCLARRGRVAQKDLKIFVVDSFMSDRDRVPSYWYPFPLKKVETSISVAGEYLISGKESEQKIIAVADPQGQLDFARSIVAFELEHLLDFHYDRAAFVRNGRGDHYHPLYQDCRIKGIKSGLMREPKSELNCAPLIKKER